MSLTVAQEPVVNGDLQAETVQEPAVAAVETCPKCAGPMLKSGVGYVGIYGWWIERSVRPAGPLGPSRNVSSDVAALACSRCGYIEFYARDPRALLGGEEYN